MFFGYGPMTTFNPLSAVCFPVPAWRAGAACGEQAPGKINAGHMKGYKKKFTFKIGTTSYILPVKEDNLVSNVGFLKDSFDIVQLLFFGREYLDEVMSPRIIRDLAAIREDAGLAYTVHLPSDLGLLDASDDSLRSSLDVLERVIDETAPLGVEGYVLHVDRLVNGAPRVEPDAVHRELYHRALDAIRARLGSAAANICIENTTYDLVFFSGIIMKSACNVCLDAGHLALHNQDPEKFIEVFGPRIRQVHLHGIAGGRDHQALTGLDAGTSGSISRFLHAFNGSVIIEVYNFLDLVKSAEYIESILY